MQKLALYIFIFFITTVGLFGQELRSTDYNEALLNKQSFSHNKHILKDAGNPTSTIILPFFDDFVYYYKSAYPNPDLWTDNSAFVNSTYADSVISVGVVTLDAMDEFGNIYATNDSVTESDVLTSGIINLSNNIIDSIYLSFFVQGGGKADWPEDQDSLFLEFFDSTQWITIWKTPGYRSNTFQQKIFLIDSIYKTSLFQFRFKNLTSLSPKSVIGKDGALSNVDCWNLDYIEVKQAGSRTEMENINDVVFTKPLGRTYVNYEAIPVAHFGTTDPENITVRNPISIKADFPQYPNELISIIRRHAKAFIQDSVKFNFEPISSEVRANQEIGYNDYIQRIGNSGEFKGEFYIASYIDVNTPPFSSLNKTENDTIKRFEFYDNYYAYDDGIPELGFGITGEDSYQAQLSVFYKGIWDAGYSDTLSAIDIYFNKTRNNFNSNKEFRIAVWTNGSDEDTTAPSDLLYISDEYNLHKTEFTDTLPNGFLRFNIDSIIILSNPSFHIGIIQETVDFLNIGYDVNNDNRGNTFLKTSNEWFTLDSSVVGGTLLMRPVFGEYIAPEPIETKNKITKLTLAPNPATSTFEFKFNTDNLTSFDDWQYSIYDFSGKLIDKSIWNGQLVEINHLEKGLYIVKILNLNSRQEFLEKLIKIE